MTTLSRANLERSATRDHLGRGAAAGSRGLPAARRRTLGAGQAEGRLSEKARTTSNRSLLTSSSSSSKSRSQT